MEFNTTAAREHIGEIERYLCGVQERVQCTTSEFPFWSIPTMVMIYTVYNRMMWLNAFPIRSGITGGFSPRELMTEMTVDFTGDCNVNFGACFEASADAIITNNDSEQTHSCIALGPSGNIQGSINCFDFKTGRVMVRRTVKQIPWTDRLFKVAN